MQKLPIGIQSFEIMRQEDYLYIDKTATIYRLVNGAIGRYFFLSRPRRFGKSLLISTLNELFLGNKYLFEDLWIATSDYVWKKYPIIYLDFSVISSTTPEELRANLSWKLDGIGKLYGFHTNTAPSPETKLEALVDHLAQEEHVVILIDEYDKPLLNHVNDIKTMRSIQSILSNFYSAIKAVSRKTKFLLMTGVTKFSKTSVFSGMNNLTDLSLSEETATLLGYTQSEIDQYLSPYIKAIAEEQQCSIEQISDLMRYWYNGYQFSQKGQKVYNPFSILAYLLSKELRNYWFETGTPSFLVNLIKEKKYDIQDLEHTELNINSINSFEIDDMQLVPLLLQTGYLTIKGYDYVTHNYLLGYPNEETKTAFLQYFVRILTQAKPDFFDNTVSKLKHALACQELTTFFSTLKVFFASIPYTIQLPQEQYYQSIFYVLLNLIGTHIQAEVTTNNGRIDCTIITQSSVYIFEFKLNGTSEQALAQIKEKEYYQKFLADGKEIILVGAAFDKIKRNIKDWIYEVRH